MPASKSASVTIKNSSTSSANVIVQGSVFDGQSDWTIVPGNAFDFTPIGVNSYDVN
jgi:hypothetical protein